MPRNAQVIYDVLPLTILPHFTARAVGEFSDANGAVSRHISVTRRVTFQENGPGPVRPRPRESGAHPATPYLDFASILVITFLSPFFSTVTLTVSPFMRSATFASLFLVLVSHRHFIAVHLDHGALMRAGLIVGPRTNPSN